MIKACYVDHLPCALYTIWHQCRAGV